MTRLTSELLERRAEGLAEKLLEEYQSDPRSPYRDLAIYLAPMKPYMRKGSKENERLMQAYLGVRTSRERQKIRDELIYRNIQLVLSVAYKYSSRGLSLLDLVQEGVIGFIKGIERYDPKWETKISTYALWWIRQAMQSAIIDNSGLRPYRISVHQNEQVALVARAIKLLSGSDGPQPSNREILKMVRTFGTNESKKITAKNVAACSLILYEEYASLYEAAYRDNKFLTVEDTIANRLENPDQMAAIRAMLDDHRDKVIELQEIIAQLPPRECMVIRLRFGLNDFHPMTLEEIGERYELTRQRIQQIECRGLRRLREDFGVRQDLEEFLRTLEQLTLLAAADDPEVITEVRSTLKQGGAIAPIQRHPRYRPSKLTPPATEPIELPAPSRRPPAHLELPLTTSGTFRERLKILHLRILRECIREYTARYPLESLSIDVFITTIKNSVAWEYISDMPLRHVIYYLLADVYSRNHLASAKSITKLNAHGYN